MIIALSCVSFGRADVLLHGVKSASSEVGAPRRRGAVHPAQLRTKHLKPESAADAAEPSVGGFLEGEERPGQTLEFEPERSGDSRGQT